MLTRDTTAAAGHRRDGRPLLPADVVRGHGGPRVRGHVELLEPAAHRPLLLALGGDRLPRKARQAMLFHSSASFSISRSSHLPAQIIFFSSSIWGGILLAGGLYFVLWGKNKEETRAAMASGQQEHIRELDDVEAGGREHHVFVNFLWFL